MNKICLDVESQNLFQEVGGPAYTDRLKVACVCIYDYSSNSFATYDHNEVELVKKLMLEAEEIVYFSGDRFDAPVIWGNRNSQMPKELVGKTSDIYRRICIAAGRNPNVGNKGFGLGPISLATLGKTKLENGKDAPQMWRDGQWGRLLRYCLSDTALCRDLNDFIDKNGYVNGPKGQKIEIPKWKPFKQ